MTVTNTVEVCALRGACTWLLWNANGGLESGPGGVRECGMNFVAETKLSWMPSGLLPDELEALRRMVMPGALTRKDKIPFYPLIHLLLTTRKQ